MVKKRVLWQKENSNVLTIDIRYVWKLIELIPMLCICFALFIGCGSDSDDTDSPMDLMADNLPNLDDPKVQEQILAEALDEDHLQTRNSPSGEQLYYAPNQEAPWTGWVKATENNVPFALWQVQNGKRHGIHLTWYSNQQNELKGFYKDSSKDGKWTYWYENGQKSEEGTFKDGAESGLWTYWHKNGKKSSEGTFKDGVKDGKWTYWDGNGQKSNEGTFKDGVKDGKWTYWHENGKKSSEGTFNDGVKSGLWTCWDENDKEWKCSNFIGISWEIVSINGEMFANTLEFGNEQSDDIEIEQQVRLIANNWVFEDNGWLTGSLESEISEKYPVPVSSMTQKRSRTITGKYTTNEEILRITVVDVKLDVDVMLEPKEVWAAQIQGKTVEELEADLAAETKFGFRPDPNFIFDSKIEYKWEATEDTLTITAFNEEIVLKKLAEQPQ